MVEGEDYLDVNVFVYWLAGDPKFGSKALDWIKRVEEKPDKFVTCSLTVWEVLVIASGLAGRNLRDYDFVNEIVRAVIETGIRIVDLKVEDFLSALSFVSQGLDLEDSIHLSVAKRLKCKRIVSNDRDFEKFIERTF
ncbi:MAG: VapC toxin family PIN domain ribonuclease [Thermoproteota archaeon]|nr:MAG: VapC toxin family PIN domain ribonuclease [Candidatus Korarchaeota archaeon]